MEPMLDQALAAAAERQHGVFAVPLLDALGFTHHQRCSRVDRGLWIAHFAGVYRMAGAPVTWRGTLLAAVLAGGPKAVASHRSGAGVWGLDGGDRHRQEILCPRWRRDQHPGLVVHESKALDARDVTVVDAIPTTTVERTLLDLGAVRHPLTVERAVETALRKELTTLPDLRATLRRLGRKGRNGAGVLRRILDDRDPDRRLTESEMEMRMLQVLRAHGLPEPIPQFEIRHQGRFVARVDAAYPDLRIALEYESFEWHTGKAALVRDSTRRNAVVGAGWLPIAVTWEDLRSGGQRVCDEVLRARCRRAA
ncbi:MAG: hypothetical protein WDA60_05755 [Acidimicrobiia bacterium]|jgi:hypothetical protein